MTEASGAGSGGGLRVLRVFSRLNIGGPSLHVILLSAGLRPLGYETRLVVGRESPREGNMLPLAAEKNVACESMVGLGREIAPLSDLRALARLHRLMRAWRPAIVHTHTAKAGVLGRIAARAAGVPTVVHTYHGHVLRGYFSPAQTALFRWLETRLAAAADALVAVSASVKQDLVALGIAPSERIRVIPLGLDLAPLAVELPHGCLRGEAGIPVDAPLVGMVGRLVPIKDVPTFLRAARIVRETRPEARFALVGDGEERPALESLCRGLGLDGRATFFGWRRDLAAVYGDLDMVVNASRNEGTPVALIEALAAAKPVVATRVGGTPDLLGEGERGRLVPPGDPESLARAVLETLEGSEAARRRAQAGREYVMARHSSDRLVRDVDALYRDLRAAKKAA
ncbi:MAG TPA: glycosyltransferase [Vicinamibacteria bacterium]|nr:glycosyltransferase [Vicinamibacteria bacterium]